MGSLTDAVRRLIDSLQVSSASPGHINVVLQTDPSIDLDEALREALQETDTTQQKSSVVSTKQEERKKEEGTKKSKKEVTVTKKTVEGWDKGQVGDIQRMTTQQFGNLKDFASNPFLFITKKIFGRFAKGAGIIILALIIFEAVKFVISELLKPGRFLDRRFKRDITKEIISFRRREDQQKLKQGFSNIIIVTGPRLRGGQGQTYNTLDRVRTNTFPQGIGLPNILLEASGISFSKGKGRRNFSRGTG